MTFPISTTFPTAKAPGGQSWGLGLCASGDDAHDQREVLPQPVSPPQMLLWSAPYAPPDVALTLPSESPSQDQ